MLQRFLKAFRKISSQNAVLKQKRKSNTIILVAGHHRAGWTHRRDTGAVCPFESTNEHYEAEKVVYQAASILRRDGFTVEVCPFDKNLSQKISWINRNFSKHDVLLSVHLNASANKLVSGVETWYLGGSPRGARVGKKIQQVLAQTLCIKDRGTKPDTANRHGRLGILRDTVVQGNEWLIELGFITNYGDLQHVRLVGPQAVADAAKESLHAKNT